MLFSLKQAISLLKQTRNVMFNKAPQTTGPRAIKNGFICFLRAVGINTNGYEPAGIYEGGIRATEDGELALQAYEDFKHIPINDLAGTVREKRNCTVIGHKSLGKEWVDRDGLGNKKMEYLSSAGIEYHLQTRKKEYNGLPAENLVSCEEHISRQEERINKLNLTLSSTIKRGAYRYEKADYVVNEDRKMVDAKDLSTSQ
uniref:Uncharacterized protein n=1 Tax=Ditylum brightwellii TaxID=49249 RepID=A0A7S4S2B6_9STRA